MYRAPFTILYYDQQIHFTNQNTITSILF